MAMISDNDAQFGGKMHGVSLLFVFLVLSAGIVAETTESLKIINNKPTLISDYTNSSTNNIQVNSLEGATENFLSSIDDAKNITNASSVEQESEEITLRNLTLSEYSGTDTSSSLSKVNVIESPETNTQSHSPQENAVGERNRSTNIFSEDLNKSLPTTTEDNEVSSVDVPTIVSKATVTSIKSPVTSTDAENVTINNLISSLTTVSMNRNDTLSERGAFENPTITVKDMPYTMSTVPDTNEATEQKPPEVQPIQIDSNITSSTNGTEEALPHSSGEIQIADVNSGGNATVVVTRTPNEYTATLSDTNKMPENETISSLTKSNAASSENTMLADSTISLNATDHHVSPESTTVGTTTLSSNSIEPIASENSHNPITSNYTHSTTETAGNTTSSSEEVSPENETVFPPSNRNSMETTVSSPQNSTFLKSTTSTVSETDTDVSDRPTDNTYSNVTTVSSTTDVMENIMHSPNTTVGDETTVSNDFSSESTEYTATSNERSTSSYPTSEDPSSDVSNSSATDTNNINSTIEVTTVEVTTQKYSTATVTPTMSVESSLDPTFTDSKNNVMTTDVIPSESSTDETSSEISSAKTSDVRGTSSSTTYYATSTTEITNHSSAITEATNTQSSTVTTQKISTTTNAIPETTTNELGPPLNHFRVTDKNGVDCIIFSVRLELLVSYTINSGAIADERIKVPIVDNFEGACGFADQYVSASWRIPKAGTNNSISFNFVKAANNSSYTLKVIRVNMVLDKVNFPDAEHEGSRLFEEMTPHFYNIPTGRGLKCATRKSYVGTNVTMIASDVELMAFNVQRDQSPPNYGGCPLASAPPLQAEEVAAIAVGVALALVTASLATALVFRKRRTRNNKFYLTANTWA